MRSTSLIVTILLLMALWTSNASAQEFSHAGYVVCEDNKDDEGLGQSCFDNWDNSDAQDTPAFFSRNDVGRRVQLFYGTITCNFTKLLPRSPWRQCAFKLGATMDICKTKTGPCFRVRSSTNGLLQQIEGLRSNPDGKYLPGVYWRLNLIPTAANFRIPNQWCTGFGGPPMFEVTISPGDDVPVFLEIERSLNGGPFTDIYEGDAYCLPYEGEATFRGRSSSYDGEGDWITRVAAHECDYDDTRPPVSPLFAKDSSGLVSPLAAHELGVMIRRATAEGSLSVWVGLPVSFVTAPTEADIQQMHSEIDELYQRHFRELESRGLIARTPTPADLMTAPGIRVTATADGLRELSSLGAVRNITPHSE